MQTTQSRTRKLTAQPPEPRKIGEQKTYTEIPWTAHTLGGFKKPMPKISEINEKPEEYMRHVKEFVEKPVGLFLISGKNGNGKTFTSQAIYEHFWHPHTDNQFWNQADLKMKWQSLYAQYGSTDYFFGELVKAPLLVLDDIGTTRPSEAFMEFLYNISDKRHQFKNTHGTIITTNLNSTSMREMFGDAFVSRVACGRCVRHDGPDRRPMLF